MRNMALEIIANNENLKQKLENLTAAVGIGTYRAIMIICELELLPEH